MQYSIGEVAAITNLSRDMVRYYEKQGAIKALRNPENNYRYYDEMEVFWLLEAVQHKSWGIPINEIESIRRNEFTVKTSKFLEKRIDELKRETSYLTLLKERLNQLKTNMSLGRINIGNFWVTNMPTTYRSHFVRAVNDDYERIDISKEVSKVVFSDKLTPFFDSGFTIKGNTIDWEMSINAYYCEELNEKLGKDFVYVPQTLALCTHIDIGEIGEFDLKVFDVMRDYARVHHYETCKNDFIQGYFLGRGYESGRFRRIVRAFLPIL